MWIKENISLSLILAFVTSSAGAPVTYEYNYAPAHEYAPKDYSFSYGVKDLHTGDVKHQWEKKEGNSVRGHYSLLEPDGSVRVVDYTADDKIGFNAVVRHKGPHYHPVSNKASSHSEFELKPSETHSQDHGILKEIEDSKPSVIQADSANYEHLDQESYGHAPEEEGQKLPPEYTYVYVPQEDIKHTDDYSYDTKSNTYGTNGELPDYEAEGSKKAVKYAIKDSKKTELPVDLSFIKPYSKEELIPLDVSLLNPVEIDLKDNYYNKEAVKPTVPSRHNINLKQAQKDSDVKEYHKPQGQLKDSYQNILNFKYADDTLGSQSTQLTEAEYQKFLKEFYESEKGEHIDPYREMVFKPVVSKNNGHTVLNTFKTNKRPVTTPGLRNYSTGELQFKTNVQSSRRPKLNSLRFRNQKTLGPIVVPDKRESNANSRLYRNAGDRYVRYARRITSYIS